MNVWYFDTNIFIYLSDVKSQYNKPSQSIVKYCQHNNVNIATSVETFQEIIHYAKNTRQLQEGIKTVKTAMRLVDNILSIHPSTIELFLEKAAKYKNVKSRDLIHLAVTLEHKISRIVTYDKEFKQFKEIKAVLPEEVTQLKTFM